MLFFQVVLPVMLIFLTGYVFQKWKKVSLLPVSSLIIYILVPSLIFRTLYDTELSADHIVLVVFAVLYLLIYIGINKLYSRIRSLDSDTESGLILSTAFMNAGNYGVPIILFAFGPEGFAYAVIYMVVQSFIMTTAGVYYAAKGGTGVRTAVATVFKMPATYAIFIVGIVNWSGVTVPEPAFNFIDLIADAAIPVTMIMLGMQLAEIRLDRLEWGYISYGVIIRLVLSPFIAWGLTEILPMSTLMQQVLIIASSMPAAVTTAIYAMQFNTRVQLVSSITLITTLLSVISVTVLLFVIL
ncbi:AEC family transporter [Evansella sp. LMS18]|jgi:predicted permease|uniref:AEC family transporter n=1 Tax=Evansella sp. LMS18 TaxID=2924033 RepID=UPI0020D0CAF8|nr:AEC family transporter [Evansella sp. LMS18]